MKDLVLALGLLFFIEGLLIAMFPSRIKNMLKMREEMPTNKLSGDLLSSFCLPEILETTLPRYQNVSIPKHLLFLEKICFFLGFERSELLLLGILG